MITMSAVLITHDPGYLFGAAWLIGSGLFMLGLSRTTAARDRARAVAFDRRLRRTRGGAR